MVVRKKPENREADTLSKKQWNLDFEAKWWHPQIQGALVVNVLKYVHTGDLNDGARHFESRWTSKTWGDLEKQLDAICNGVLAMMKAIPDEPSPECHLAVKRASDALAHMRFFVAAMNCIHGWHYRKHIEGARSHNEAVQAVLKKHIYGDDLYQYYDAARLHYAVRSESFRKYRRAYDRDRSAARKNKASGLKTEAAGGSEAAAIELARQREQARLRQQKRRGAARSAPPPPVSGEDVGGVTTVGVDNAQDPR